MMEEVCSSETSGPTRATRRRSASVRLALSRAYAFTEVRVQFNAGPRYPVIL
jgi:hypothetical protein